MRSAPDLAEVAGQVQMLSDGGERCDFAVGGRFERHERVVVGRVVGHDPVVSFFAEGVFPFFIFTVFLGARESSADVERAPDLQERGDRCFVEEPGSAEAGIEDEDFRLGGHFGGELQRCDTVVIDALLFVELVFFCRFDQEFAEDPDVEHPIGREVHRFGPVPVFWVPCGCAPV